MQSELLFNTLLQMSTVWDEQTNRFEDQNKTKKETQKQPHSLLFFGFDEFYLYILYFNVLNIFHALEQQLAIAGWHIDKGCT